MPSGAKKRKAAKKKLQKEAHNKGFQPQGNDDPKSDDRESDGGEGERDASEVFAANNHQQVTKETSLGDDNVAEIAKEVRSGEKFNDTSRESQSGDSSEEHKSSSSSSSEDDEVEVEKEKPVVTKLVEVEQQGKSSFPEVTLSNETLNTADYVPEVAPGESLATSAVVDNSAEEYISVEESVKEVVSLPQQPTPVTESVAIEDSTTSNAVDLGLKQSVNELSLPSGEQIDAKVIPVEDEGSGKSSEPAFTTARDNESLLSESPGVTNVNRNGRNDHVKESDKCTSSNEQPLVSSAPLPVRRTSWMNCCGIFEVLSGGSSR